MIYPNCPSVGMLVAMRPGNSRFLARNEHAFSVNLSREAEVAVREATP